MAGHLDHLCPFALWPALPTSLVGRHPHDYYGHSVTVGLAPHRRSRVRLRRTYRARRRPPTHLLDRPRWTAIRATEVAPASGSCRDMVGHRFQAPFRWVITCTDWRLGIRQSSFGHIARVLRRATYGRLRRPPLYRHAAVPSGFRLQVSR